RFCRIAARNLAFPVPCPSLVPDHDVSISPPCSDVEVVDCFRDQIFSLQDYFTATPLYYGMQPGFGHLIIWAASPGRSSRLGCPSSGREFGATSVDGVAGQRLWCAGPFPKSG